MNNNNKFEQAFIKSSRTFLRVNTYTNQLCVIKYKGVESLTPDSTIEVSKFLKTFLEEGTVYRDDIWQFSLLQDTGSFIQYYKHEQNMAIIYRRVENGRIVWNRMDFLVPDEHCESDPDIYVYVKDIDSIKSIFFDSFTTFAQRILKISRVSFADNSIHVIQEPHPERLTHNRYPVHNYDEELQHIANHFIHPDDAAAFKSCFSAESLQNYFSLGNSEFTYFCRRKLSGLYKWIKILIVPAIGHSATHNYYYFYMEDVHKDLNNIIDIQNIKAFSKFFGGLYRKNIETYYENMLSVLHILSQQYVDFYMVNLEKDLYIRYKPMSGTLNHDIPVVGSYSQSSISYIKEHCTGQEAEILSLYCTSDKLREAMRDRLTLEYEFHSDSGEKLRTICQKIESVNGIPTKVLARTIVVHSGHKLYLRTFGNFDVLNEDGTPVRFGRKQSKELLAYLVDHQGYPVTSRDIVTDILEKPEDDMNAIKYCSTLVRRAIKDLEAAGYTNIIIKEQKTVRINTTAVDCDYYRVLNGDLSCLLQYHNEYMKEYSWAESTNAEILSMMEK